MTAQAPTTMTAEQMLAMIAKLQADNAALAAAKPAARSITMKVAEKGGLSVYGLGRFPVSLYRSQWERLLAPDMVAEINAFIAANAALLTVKA